MTFYNVISINFMLLGAVNKRFLVHITTIHLFGKSILLFNIFIWLPPPFSRTGPNCLEGETADSKTMGVIDIFECANGNLKIGNFSHRLKLPKHFFQARNS